jgi:menaquinone-dependent protoporphyrinogen IX oxidase
MEVHMQRRTFLNLGIAGLGTGFAMANPVPMQFIPTPSNEKWAILFGTWYGTTRDASVWISEGMGGIASVFDIRQVPDLSSYDHLVIGTAIQGGRGPKALEAYLENNAKLQSKIRGLFAVCGNGGRPPGQGQVKMYIDGYLARICRVSSVPSQVFGGRITKALMPESEYQMIADFYAKSGGPSGDMDNLSRKECLKFGSEIHAAKA